MQWEKFGMFIETDNKTMKRIGITGNNGNYVYGKHIIIHLYTTNKFYNPLNTYLTFMHLSISWDGAINDIQI